MDVEDQVRQIHDVEGLATFVDALSKDAIEHGCQWENLRIFDMLESMAAWLRDTADSESFANLDVDAEALRWFAKMLLAGKHYE